MKLRILLTLTFILVISAGAAMAQGSPDPTGIPDSVTFEVSVEPTPGTATSQMVLDLYVYNDEPLIGATAGFKWNNPKIQMDSAKATPLTDTGFEIGPFFYENNNISITNANQRFLIGGSVLMGSGIPADASGRRLWARYYFTATNWTSEDNVTIDSLTFSGGSQYLFVTTVDNASFVPLWLGAILIGTPPPPNLTVSTSELNFSATQDGANPANQTFDVGTDGAAIFANVSKTQPWLTVSPTAGVTPLHETASVNIAGLTAGTYHDTISVSSAFAGNGPLKVAVNLTVAPPPMVLVVTPDTLFFTVTEGDPNPSQMLYITEQGGYSTSYAAVENSDRLMLDKTGGTTPDSVLVTSVVTGLAPGSYEDPILILAPATTNQGITVYVELTVEPAPPKVLTVSPDTLHFTAEEGSAETDGQYFYVTQEGGGNLGFTVSGANEWVLMPDTIGTTPDSVLVSILPGTLGTGNHLFMLNVNAPDADNTPQTVYVAVTITARPRMLVVSPDTLFFVGIQGEPIVDSQAIAVSEVGGDAIEYAVSDTSTWITVDPAGGITPAMNYVKIDNTGLVAGQYVDFIDVSSGSAANSPQRVAVYLTLSAPENQPPVLDPIDPQTVDEGAFLAFTVHATDPDGTFPSIAMPVGPSGANFVDSGNGYAYFDWTPAYDQAGVYNVLFVASDGVLVDSEYVEITVVNVNRVPVITLMPNDTTIDECMSLFEQFMAVDPDGDPIGMSLDPLAPNMIFEDSAGGVSYFIFNPDTTQAGTYPLTLTVTDGLDTVTAMFTITVTDCTPPPPCVNIVLTDTLFQIYDTVGTPNNPDHVLNIYSTDAEFCFTIADLTENPLPSFAILDHTAGCTPDSVLISYDKTGLAPGYYVNSFQVIGDSTVCAPAIRGFTVLLNLVDTTTQEIDTLAVGVEATVPGNSIMVPVSFINHCTLVGAEALLGWTSPYLTLDSVSWVDSRLNYASLVDTIDNEANTVALGAFFAEGGVEAGAGNFANLWFTVAGDTPPGSFLEIGLGPAMIANPQFATDCGFGPSLATPDFSSGGIMVDTARGFVCGYVVDPEGMPIEGANVELWGDFPVGGPDMSTMSDSSGYFEFNDIAFSPFDLYGYMDGYYPGLVEHINFNENGVMIVLTPVEPVYPTYEWVNFYCDHDTYFGEPLPVGSVVDAYDPDGVHCGTFTVHEAGKYGFMPVYRDDPYMEGDQGAEPGDNIRFYINGVEAQASGNTEWTVNGDSWPVCLEGGQFTSSCQLHAGWNLVSWTVDSESDYITDALASISDHIILVLGFEQGGLTYDPNLPQFSTLWYVDHLSGYWIDVDADVTLEITGAAVATATPIPVTAGWNLVSYLPAVQSPIESALQSLDGNLIVSLGFDNGGQVYLPGDSLHNTLLNMNPCMGYWVKVDHDGSLIYPGGGPVVAPQQRPLGQIAKIAADDVTPTTQWVNLYSRDLTLDGKTVAAGATVDAFNKSGVKIGSYTLKEDGVFGFMPVYADDQNTSAVEGVKVGEQFTLAINGQPVNETCTFTASGDRIELQNLTAKTGDEPGLPTDFALSQNYPNPFNPTTTISFTLPTSVRARIEIFNVLGELVATPFDNVADAGENQVVWDGTNSAGRQVASGIYFYRLTADNFSETKKMILMK